MDLIGYDELRAAIQAERKGIKEEDFTDLGEQWGIDPPAIRQVAFDLTQVAIEDMRDRERTLTEALMGMFASGMLAAFGVMEK